MPLPAMRGVNCPSDGERFEPQNRFEGAIIA